MEIKVNTILQHDWWQLDDERRAAGLPAAKAILSTEHAMSCYGLPVLVLPDGRVIGPDSVAYTDEDGYKVFGRGLKLTRAEHISSTRAMFATTDTAEELAADAADQELADRFEALYTAFTKGSPQ